MRTRFAALLTAGVLACATGCSIFGDFSGFSNGTQTANAEGGADPNNPGGGDGGETIFSSLDGGDVQTTQSDGAPNPEAPFIDTFDRPNGAVGNGWLEKVGGRFSIVDQKLSVLDGDWKRHILYRPTDEQLRDVEISAEVNWTSVDPAVDCDATLMARLTSLSSSNGSAAGYAVYINDTLQLAVSLESNGNETKLRDGNLPSSINTSNTYRMTLRVTGTSPVLLYAKLETKDPTNTWSLVREVTTQDGSSVRLQDPGSVGLTADVHSSFRYDNFTRTKL